jgi:CheY-specific phosphatase CheX
MANIKKIREMLITATFDVFEKMFFVFAEPLREKGPDYPLQASIRFSGPVEGAMKISVSGGLAKIMAENMLSLQESEITDQVIADCIKESVNMVCGCFVSKIDPDHVFHLSIPSFEMVSGPLTRIHGQPDASIRLAFAAEGGGFEVIMDAPGFL